MLICRSITETRRAVATARTRGNSIAVVPTMGFLHDGHLELVRRARHEADHVVVTIFVNPSQFGEVTDLDAYPRDEARDLELLRGAGADLVFIPEAGEIYPEGDETIVETTRLANMLHGLVRPGHFRGVTTVVARLFNIVQPDVACFGEKDYQQLQVIKRMTRDLAFPIRIVGVPTMREADGLAMSSRNVRLSPQDRHAALVLSQSLAVAETTVAAGGTIADTAAAMRAKIATERRAILRGLDITEAETLNAISGTPAGAIAIMMSVEIGGVLLIDQREIQP